MPLPLRSASALAECYNLRVRRLPVLAIALLVNALVLGAGHNAPAKDFRIRSHLLPGVPYIAQSTPLTCGAAALAMLLSYWDQPTDEADVLKLRPEIAQKGTWVPLLWEVPQTAGFKVEYGEGDLERLKQLLRSNRPVVVFQWAQPEVKRPHNRLVVGYDDTAGVFIVHDPGAPHGEGMRIPYAMFDSLWELPWFTAEDGSSKSKLYVAVLGREAS